MGIGRSDASPWLYIPVIRTYPLFDPTSGRVSRLSELEWLRLLPCRPLTVTSVASANGCLCQRLPLPVIGPVDDWNCR